MTIHGLARSSLGPFAARALPAKGIGLLLVLALTLLTQVGGLLVWPFFGLADGLATRQPTRIRGVAVWCAVLSAAYVCASQVVIPAVASGFGRVPLPIFATADSPLGPRSLGYALLLRNYVTPDLREVLIASSRRLAATHPGTVVRYLDAGFPFPGVPLLPHLSHGDAKKVDVAFLYERDGAPLDRTPSPLGYFGYTRPEGPLEEAAWQTRSQRCAGAGYAVSGVGKIPLRWDFARLQGAWPELRVDRQRTRRLLREIAADDRVRLILLEPTLHEALAAPKLQSNPCSVARHDDHAHVAVW